MVSGSSGSIQSSSNGEEEYNSRANGISSFLNNHSSSSIFDPLSNIFDPLPTRSTQNSSLNLETLCPRNPRPDPNPAELSGLIPSSSSSTKTQTFMTSQLQLPHQVAENNAPPLLTDNGVRNPRKRTRASRRAPTTVLTTDTSNFRAMVQEFTGIPAPPFTPVSSFSRPRLDLSPPYLLRPLPHKLPPFSSPSGFTNSVLNLQPQLQVSLEVAETDHNPHLQMGFLEDFSLRQGHVTAHLSSSGAGSDQDLLRSVNEKYCNDKLHYSASSSDFHGAKGSENVTARSEGMIESWICSSD